MSAHAADAHEHEHRSVWQYVVIAVILGLITLVELGPLFEWFNVPILGLVVLSALKFALVAAIFMHLADDSSVYSWMFSIPLVAAVAMVSVMMLLAHSFQPSPRDDVMPVVERHWTNYSGECTSWVRSHVSNKWYCTSPYIPQDRIAMYAAPKPGAAPAAPVEEIDVASMSEDEAIAQLTAMGESLYGTHCVACHQATGKGVPGVFPPLAGSDYPGYLDPVQHAGIIVNGLNGEIQVNGVTYQGAMTAFGQLSDTEIAAIATYERNSWGNDHGMVTPEMVASAR